MPVNSLMSAPAMKPLFFADITTTPRGGGNAIRSSRALSSRSTPLDSTLVEVSGLSTVSQTMPSLSRSIFQAEEEASIFFIFPPSGARSGRRRALLGVVRAHVEIAHQRTVIRVPHVGHAKIGHFDSLAHEDEVELDARHACGKGRQA